MKVKRRIHVECGARKWPFPEGRILPSYRQRLEFSKARSDRRKIFFRSPSRPVVLPKQVPEIVIPQHPAGCGFPDLPQVGLRRIRIGISLSSCPNFRDPR